MRNCSINIIKIHVCQGFMYPCHGGEEEQLLSQNTLTSAPHEIFKTLNKNFLCSYHKAPALPLWKLCLLSCIITLCGSLCNMDDLTCQYSIFVHFLAIQRLLMFHRSVLHWCQPEFGSSSMISAVPTYSVLLLWSLKIRGRGGGQTNSPPLIPLAYTLVMPLASN